MRLWKHRNGENSSKVITHHIRNHKTAATVAAIGVIGVIGLTMAYFTGTDAVTNRFVGSDPVEVSIVEDAYTDRQTVAYEQKIAKDPKVKNETKTPAVVFMKVTIPTVNSSGIHLVKQDGGLDNTALKTKLSVFEYLTTASSKSTLEDDTLTLGTFQYNSNWLYLNKIGDNAYLFGYYQRINGYENTETLFDSIQYKRILEHDIIKGTAEQIKIEAYAIQADHVELDGAEFITKNADGTKKTLSKDDLLNLYNAYFS